ncbi:MAG: acyl-protein synthetase [Christensenellaceae bacterium]
MSCRMKLFFHKNPYDLQNTQELFFEAVKENISFHTKHCEPYKKILEARNFNVEMLHTKEDLYKVPVFPSLYFKRNRMFSRQKKDLAIQAASSGTKGAQSIIALDKNTLFYGIIMMIRFFSYYKVISPIPTNYIVLGYEPSKHTQMGAIKTAYGTTKFAPALHREYALKDTGTRYEPNIEKIKESLIRYAKQGFPVRFVGFPSYMYFLVQSLKENGICLKLNRHSKILLGGGWKQFSNQEIDHNHFYSLIKETLGIEKANCLEFFSTVEHPLPYCKCENGHFHVPIYSRVIIRDVNTLEPVRNGQIGLLSFVTPLVQSMPLTSIVTDDLAILHDAKECGCKIKAPYFELKGRAGVQQIKTCTTDAAELLEGRI